MSDLITRTIAVLRVDGERWRALATGLDRELLARPPVPGEWSALACLGHATDTEAAVFAARVRALLAGAPGPRQAHPPQARLPTGQAGEGDANRARAGRGPVGALG